MAVLIDTNQCLINDVFVRAYILVMAVLIDTNQCLIKDVFVRAYIFFNTAAATPLLSADISDQTPTFSSLDGHKCVNVRCWSA